MLPFRRLRRYLTKPHVRPWALGAPLLVLLVCLPLLRPLRHPNPSQVSDDEAARLATVQAIVERGTLALAPNATPFVALDNTIRGIDGRIYSEQPPAYAVMLSGPYWVMHRCGKTSATSPVLVAYLLTVIGAAVPAAAAAGLIYRMGRLFELKRPVRAGLALAVVFGSGLVSYGTVLNAHAPAAALVLAAAACLIHVVIAKQPSSTGAWLALAGALAALAGAVEPPAAVFALLLVPVVPAMRWSRRKRAWGTACYALGILPVLALHAILVRPMTGDAVPGVFHPEQSTKLVVARPSLPSVFGDADDDAAASPGAFDALGRGTAGAAAALLGDHGLLSHFPVLLLGVLGVVAVMHRHWPNAAKMMAAATVIAAAVIMAATLDHPAGAGVLDALTPGLGVANVGFAAAPSVVFVPMLLFWSGAWLRRRHHPFTWALAGGLLAFSVSVTLVGATDPLPRGGYHRYTPTVAWHNLTHPEASAPPVLAGG